MRAPVRFPTRDYVNTGDLLLDDRCLHNPELRICNVGGLQLA